MLPCMFIVQKLKNGKFILKMTLNSAITSTTQEINLILKKISTRVFFSLSLHAVHHRSK